ncbi:Cancer/testis antigen 47A [Manis javanica]|nr:Cancer/testis antigen 47A [Manis javanica]
MFMSDHIYQILTAEILEETEFFLVFDENLKSCNNIPPSPFYSEQLLSHPKSWCYLVIQREKTKSPKDEFDLADSYVSKNWQWKLPIGVIEMGKKSDNPDWFLLVPLLYLHGIGWCFLYAEILDVAPITRFDYNPQLRVFSPQLEGMKEGNRKASKPSTSPQADGSSSTPPVSSQAPVPRASPQRQPPQGPPTIFAVVITAQPREVEVLPGAMSATGDGDQVLGGQESPVGVAGVWAEVVGAGDPGVGDSKPHGGDAVGAARVAGAVGGLGEEAVELVVDRNGEEGSDIRQAEESQSDLMVSLEIMVDGRPSLLEDPNFMFLDLVHWLLRIAEASQPTEEPEDEEEAAEPAEEPQGVAAGESSAGAVGPEGEEENKNKCSFTINSDEY